MKRVIVVGAGVIGLAAARELRRRGADVLLLDRHHPGSAASSGNAGWIVPSYSTPLPAPGLIRTSSRWMLRRDSPLYLRPRPTRSSLTWLLMFARACRDTQYTSGLKALSSLNAQTMQLFDELRADGVDFEMHTDGLLFAGLSSEAVHHAAKELRFLERLGYAPIVIRSGSEIRVIEPALSDSIAAGFHIANERHVRPESLVKGLATWLAAHNVEIRTGVNVVSVDRVGASGVVQTENGPLKADQILIAGGVWTGELLRRSGFRLPVEAGKGYSITWETPDWQLRQPVDLIEAHVACTPFEGALRMAGTMELSGLNDRLVPERVEAIRRAGRSYFRSAPSGVSERAWVGARPMLPDGLPAIGPVSGFSNLFVATGHAMLGVTLAPATAVAIAEMMDQPNLPAALTPFDPNRFSR